MAILVLEGLPCAASEAVENKSRAGVARTELSFPRFRFEPRSETVFLGLAAFDGNASCKRFAGIEVFLWLFDHRKGD